MIVYVHSYIGWNKCLKPVNKKFQHDVCQAQKLANGFGTTKCEIRAMNIKCLILKNGLKIYPKKNQCVVTLSFEIKSEDKKLMRKHIKNRYVVDKNIIDKLDMTLLPKGNICPTGWCNND